MVSRRTFLATVGSAAVAGCTGGRGLAALRTSTPSVTLLLNWKPSGLHVPYYAAKRRGFYEDAGVEVARIRSGQGSDASAKQVGTGNVPLAVTSSDQVVNIASRGLTPRAVGVVMQRSPVMVFATREGFGGELTSADQLRGSTVGTGPGMVRILTELLLKRKGVLSDVDLVDTGYDTVQRLLSGKIDAAGGVFGDVISVRHRGYATDALRVADVVPAYGHVLAAAPKFESHEASTVEAFLRGTAHGAAWATNNPEAATDTLVKAVPALEPSRAIEADKWKMMSRQFMLSPAVREHGWGWSESKPWKSTYSALDGAGLLGGPVDPSTVWTNDYLDTENRYIGSYADLVSGPR